MEEVLEEGIEMMAPTNMGGGSVGDGSRDDETNATDVVHESPHRINIDFLAGAMGASNSLSPTVRHCNYCSQVPLL